MRKPLSPRHPGRLKSKQASSNLFQMPLPLPWVCTFSRHRHRGKEGRMGPSRCVIMRSGRDARKWEPQVLARHGLDGAGLGWMEWVCWQGIIRVARSIVSPGESIIGPDGGWPLPSASRGAAGDSSARHALKGINNNGNGHRRKGRRARGMGGRQWPRAEWCDLGTVFLGVSRRGVCCSCSLPLAAGGSQAGRASSREAVRCAGARGTD
ncbi:hypothetical protein B0J12DRAFT_684552 [Macrophomina phaseolina]|uniref:Uncharacterized protein n=1 Tax=Macrophomina phaseolina TaxID=35725 RepID=A0ABQ8FUP9_9PEZI|nr:hypothetical protein B0J12DRAFT_684552 [Macrophomina phaseolina]